LLVIEDQPALLTMVASLLREAGHDVREASTVAAALSALDESLPEAVVLDLVLDAPSAALRERLRAAKLPALLVSGANESDARNAAIAHGWDVVLKPFEPEDLLARVARLSPTPHRRPTMPPPSPLSLPALPTVEPPSTAHDPWRDRIRVVLDRVIYLVALVSVVLLARAKALDLQTAAAILLVAGVRPHNLFEALRGGGARGAMVLPLLLDNLRSGSWLAR
jgi:CheY-like chemotaxis protein